MPWVNETLCTGCGICIRECPVDAMAMNADQRAWINDDECIRCGRCHDVCPRQAVRHDSERIPQEVADNLRWVRKLLRHFQTRQEQTAFMQRMERFFKKQIKVNEQTLSVVSAGLEGPTAAIDAALGQLDKQRGNQKPARGS